MNELPFLKNHHDKKVLNKLKINQLVKIHMCLYI